MATLVYSGEGAIVVTKWSVYVCRCCHCAATGDTWQEARDAIQHDPACPEYRERKDGEA